MAALVFLTHMVYSYTILPKVLAPLLMQGLTTLVISMSTNLNVEAYNDILRNLIVYQQFGPFSILTWQCLCV